MSTVCETCSGKGYVRCEDGTAGNYYFDKCHACRGSKRAPHPIGSETDLAARRLITAAEVRRRAGEK